MSGESNKGIVVHGGTIKAGAIAAGDAATAISHGGHQDSAQLDLPKLTAELELLRTALRQQAHETEQDMAVVAVGDAMQSARQGNGAGVLEHLKKAGTWAFDVATKIGVSVASEAIKTAMKG
jgi:hypothetical protein